MPTPQTTDAAASLARHSGGELLARLAQQGKSAADLERARSIADIVAELTDDADIVAGAALFALLEAQALTPEQAATQGGPTAARIATELVRLGSFSITMSAGLSPGRGTTSLSANQAEALRKMLLAIVTDPRLVLIKLAAQLHRLRESRDAPVAERERLAFETKEIYAPLANRLEIGRAHV